MDMNTTDQTQDVGPIRPQWLALHSEAPIDPDLPIVDAHHHLFSHPGWTYLADHYRTDLDCGHKVVATVFVQGFSMYDASLPAALQPTGETVYADTVAETSARDEPDAAQLCSAIVGFADLTLGAGVEEVLHSHLLASQRRFRGVRQIAAWDADPRLASHFNAPEAGLLRDARFREGFSRLAPLDLSYDTWIYSPQIDELADLAAAFPETRIILDHLGTPPGVGVYEGRIDEVFGLWRKAIAKLAERPNVFLKLGGMGQDVNGFGWEVGAAPPSSEVLAARWRPYFETCIEHFSPSRCMFESNFPVDKASFSYGTFWNACKLATHDLSRSEKSQVFAGAAALAYRLELALRTL